MNRRDILKQLAILSGGIMLVPSCDFSKNDVLKAYDNLQITADHKATLQKLCNTIIPSDTDHIGADELKLSDFVLVMINDCYSPEDQRIFTEGLKNLDQYSLEQTRQNFQSMSSAHANELINQILNHSDPDVEHSGDQVVVDFEQIRYCVRTTKHLTVQGYMTSEYIMKEVMPYKLVPGPFHGKLRIEENEKANIYG
ncbi:gluconate 2-dehydrogenase subunit 3 family protein [Membranicola marinus]|uniref:Gluconate 2-dehydrogenase subunit 3 family protein n=1 Tax=Membranihabitans marinus TaxID=1227546 RepID=A0A953LA56_9BACT|nr:gluconate 2-dehydrogenase subunit 3 family protein [Membranihabitans marinus]MBY5959565.1 gluconate 2-dehydrogenase subunit 3 family protein [Membranihabitans marinus]